MKAAENPVSKKRVVLVLFVLAVVICGIVSLQTASIYKRLTKNIESLGIYSITIVPYTTDYPLIENLTDQDFIDHVSCFLKEASFRGLISESNIIRTSEKRYVRLLLVAADNRCYEIQLTDQKDDECYIRPMTGLYSENSYIKIGNCQDLYSYVWNYMKAKAYAEDAQHHSSPSAEVTETIGWQQAYLDYFTDTILPTQAEVHPSQPIYGASLMDIDFNGVPELMIWDLVASGAATGMLYKTDGTNVVPASEHVYSTNIIKGRPSGQAWPMEDLHAFLLVRSRYNGEYFWAVHDGNGQDDRAWGTYLVFNRKNTEISSYDSTKKADRTIAWDTFNSQFEVLDIDYSDFTLSVYMDGEINASALGVLLERWQSVQIDLEARTGFRTAYTAVSGGVSVPLVPIGHYESPADAAEQLNWLPITYDESSQPFEIIRASKRVSCSYSILDAETLKAVNYFRPSGLAPQTYLFQNTVPGRRYLITVYTLGEDGDYAFGAIAPERSDQMLRERMPTVRNADGTELMLGMDINVLDAAFDVYLGTGHFYMLPQHSLGVAAIKNTDEPEWTYPVAQLSIMQGWTLSWGPGIGATTKEVRAWWGEPDVSSESTDQNATNYLLYYLLGGQIEFVHSGGVITRINLYSYEAIGKTDGLSVIYYHGRESARIENVSLFGELYVQCIGGKRNQPGGYLTGPGGHFRMAVTAADGTETVLAEGEDACQITIPTPRIGNGRLDVELEGEGGAWILVVNWSKPEFHE